LLEIGPGKLTDAGVVPVEWIDIKAWAEMTKTDLPGHESLLIRQLSKDYCNQYVKGRKPSCPEPGDPVEVRKNVAVSFRNIVKQFRG